MLHDPRRARLAALSAEPRVCAAVLTTAVPWSSGRTQQQEKKGSSRLNVLSCSAYGAAVCGCHVCQLHLALLCTRPQEGAVPWRCRLSYPWMERVVPSLCLRPSLLGGLWKRWGVALGRSQNMDADTGNRPVFTSLQFCVSVTTAQPITELIFTKSSDGKHLGCPSEHTRWIDGMNAHERTKLRQ